MERIIKPHKKYQEFQKKYGYIPASDKNDLHIIRSRMLQGIYRNEKIENIYCNYISGENAILNFMNNERIYKEALQELEKIKQRKRITDKKRALTNLLSSQPLAFNIFIPLRWNNYKLATETFKSLYPELNIDRITDIKLEYVPGDTTNKKDRVITTDNSCFDVFIEYKPANNDKLSCFGIEVKYTESFSETNFNSVEGNNKERYVKAINDYNELFIGEYTQQYLGTKYNQLFRNQVITEEVKDKFKTKYQNCFQIVLYSKEDMKCITAITDFPKMLKIQKSFITLTIEETIEEILKYTNMDETALYNAIYQRYCNYELVKDFIK